MNHIFLDSTKTLLSMILICDPASIYNLPPCASEDSNRLYKFTYRKLHCRPDATEERSRCCLAVENLKVSIFISSSHSFPPRSLQDGFMKYVAFFDQMLSCGSNAAEARSRCCLAVKNLTVSIFNSGSDLFPPRSLQDGFMKHIAFS